jgi:hypothetical protein
VNTAKPEAALIEQFLNRETSRGYFKEAAQFGNEIFDLIETIGNRGQLHRLLVV